MTPFRRFLLLFNGGALALFLVIAARPLVSVPYQPDGQTVGNVLTWNGATWTPCVAGASGYVLASAGPAQALYWSPAGVSEARLVEYALPLTTTVTVGAGLAASGALSSGFSVSATRPMPAGAATGDVAYWSSAVSNWVVLPAGTSGYTLAAAGAGVAPYWTEPSGGITVSGATLGDLLTYNGSSWVRLPIGPSTYVLTSAGAGSVPYWTESQGTAVADTGTSSLLYSVELTSAASTWDIVGLSLVTSTIYRLHIFGAAGGTVASSNVSLEINGDTTGGHYKHYQAGGSSTTIAANASGPIAAWSSGYAWDADVRITLPGGYPTWVASNIGIYSGSGDAQGYHSRTVYTYAPVSSITVLRVTGSPMPAGTVIALWRELTTSDTVTSYAAPMAWTPGIDQYADLLVDYWPLDTSTRGAVHQTTWITENGGALTSGVRANAWRFTRASSSFMRMERALITDFSLGWALSLWLNLSTTGIYQYVYAQSLGNDQIVVLSVNNATDKLVAAMDNGAGGAVNLTFDTALSAGQWHHVLLAYSPHEGKVRGYLDSTMQSTELSWSGTWRHSDPRTSLGTWINDPGYCFDGAIDEPCAYQGIDFRTVTEMDRLAAALYGNGTPPGMH